MAIDPYDVALEARYIGAPFRKEIRLDKDQGDGPAMVPLLFQWAAYGVSQSDPSVAVAVNLRQGPKGTLISAIRALYIDNTNSDGSIYVYFPDTQHTVTCAPFSTAWCPVLTSVFEFLVIAKGFGSNDDSQTRIELFNVAVTPSVDPEIQYTYPQFLASPQISRGVNQFSNGWGSPAIGDQWQFIENISTSAVLDFPLFGSPYTQGGNITLTDINIGYGNLTNADTANKNCTISVLSTGQSGTYWSERWFGNATSVGPPHLFLEQDALQHKLNAAETWLFRLDGHGSGSSTGFFNIKAGFCYTGPQLSSNRTFGNLANNNIGGFVLNAATPFGGFGFAPPASGILTSVDIQINGTPADLPIGTYHLELWTNVGVSPGVKVGSSSNSFVPSVPSNGHQINTWTMPANCVVSNLQFFWIIIVPDAPATSQLAIDVSPDVAQFATDVAATIAGLAIAPSDEFMMNINMQTT